MTESINYDGREKGAEIVRALNSTEDDLLAILGYFSAQSQMYATPPDKRRFIDLGKEWVAVNEKKLQSIICENEKIKQFASSDDNLVDLGILIMDAIASTYSGFPIVVIAAWIMKKGVNTLCHGFWN